MTKHGLKAGSFYPSLIRTLGDVKAAILLSHLIDLEASPIACKSASISDATGLSGGDIAKARTRLEAFGILSTKRTSAGIIMYVNQDVLEKQIIVGSVRSGIVDNTNIIITTIRDPTDHEVAPPQPVASTVSFQDVLSGKLDGTKINPSIAQCLLDKWCEIWGVRANTAKVTPQRMTTLRRVVADGVPLSTFAKAMLGMRHDDWVDRPKFNDWQHVARNIPRWVGLYEAAGAPSASGAGQQLKTIVTKAGARVRVPTDYAWNESDEFMLARGYQFDVGSKQWVRQ